MYDFDILVWDFMQRPLASLNLRSENSTTNLIILVTNCFPVHNCFGFYIAGLTKYSLVLAGLYYKREKVD